MWHIYLIGKKGGIEDIHGRSVLGAVGLRGGELCSSAIFEFIDPFLCILTESPKHLILV